LLTPPEAIAHLRVAVAMLAAAAAQGANRRATTWIAVDHRSFARNVKGVLAFDLGLFKWF